ncbi:hypothetical protein ABXP84_001939 [Campylobacter coli]
MKKIFLAFMVLVNCVFASDELNIDSLFKKQIGLRSITSFSLLSTGNVNSYSLYPNITNGKIIGFRVRKFKDIIPCKNSKTMPKSFSTWINKEF